MIAESGRMRPGAMSRLRAMWSRVVHSSRTAASARRSRTLWIPDVRRHRSRRVGVRFEGAQILEFLGGPIGLALLGEHRRDGGRAVRRAPRRPGRRSSASPPAAAAWTSRRRRVPSSGRRPSSRCTIVGQVHPVDSPPAGRPARCRRASSVACRSRPGTAGPGRRRAGPTRRWPAPRRPVRASSSGSAPWLTGSISTVPAPVAPDLHQIGAVGVAEARRPLGVDRERAVPGCQKRLRPSAISYGVTDSGGTPSAGASSGVASGSAVSAGSAPPESASVIVRRGCGSSGRSPRPAAGRRRARAPRRTPARAGPAPASSPSTTRAAPADGRAAGRRCRRSAPTWWR